MATGRFALKPDVSDSLASTAPPLNLSAAPAPGAGDRMSFAVFLAGAVHALVLFGIGFVAPLIQPPKLPVTLDVVLAQQYSDTAPDKPDFLAQANQQGGGDKARATPLRTPEQAEMPAPQVQEVMQPAQGGQPQTARDELQVSQRGERAVPQQTAQTERQAAETPAQTDSLATRALQIASLSAELAAQREMEARSPRTRLVSPSTAETRDAAYLNAWRRKVERIGNLNYPDEAKRQKLFGELVLRVDVRADGTINEIRVLQSSGQKLLDDAAVRIVRLAAPFAPFPAEMRKETDVLQIVRLWRFEPEGGFFAQ